MVALRTRPRGAVVAPFGLFTFAFAVLPAPIGTQDLAALFSYQAVAAQTPSPVRVSPFGTIHLATYSFPQPVGSAIPRLAGYRLASLDPAVFSDVPGAFSYDGDVAEPPILAPVTPPRINRRLKGDSLLVPPRLPLVAIAPPPRPVKPELHAALPPAPDPQVSAAPAHAPDAVDADAPAEAGAWPELGPAELSPSDNPTMDTARHYIGDDPADAKSDQSAESALIPLPAQRPAAAGETVASKGEVTGKDKRPQSLAARLGLNAKARAKAEKCLANAVYFEARGESVRGQIAVAQVVMNRVFSEFYPDNVCDVVYQNAHRHLACQFTFACDGIRDVVTEPDAWTRAKRIAKDTIDGTLWLDHVGKATHYHAYWVRPWWIRTMRKLHKIGVHTFYRPKRWGDGSDEPVWGSAAATAEMVKKL